MQYGPWPSCSRATNVRASLSHLKRESQPSPIKLVFWGDWAFPREGPLESRFSNCIGASGLPVVVGSWRSSNLVCDANMRNWGPERPRTGGWSLLAMMSDWQHGVDWLLVEYCMCRLQLDLRWCRWRAGAEGFSLCGLRGVETSRLGLMDPVAERDQVRAAWWQEEQDGVRYNFLVEPRNQGRAGTTWWPRHEWDWCGGCTESAGFAVVHHKTIGVPWLSHKTKTRASAGGGGIRACRATSKRRIRVGIARLALRSSEVRSSGIRPMVLRWEFPKCP
jgi:hypothetical protein